MKPFLKGAVLALGLAAAAAATPAAATNIVRLNSLTMDTNYIAHIQTGSINEWAYSNGLNFSVTNIDGPNAGVTEDVFAFCIDVFHNISLGGLNDFYQSTNGDEPNPPLYDGSGVQLSGQTLHTVTYLADLGFRLHNDTPFGMSAQEASLRTAAIQAAIWEVEHPGSITLANGGAGVNGFTYQGLFDEYRGYTGPGARVYTLTDVGYGDDHESNHQGFVVGWPRSGTPEPATWALMVGGFLGAGSALRRRKASVA